MPSWESPLRPGDVCVCHDGLVVEILSTPEDVGEQYYSVDVRIVELGCFEDDYEIGDETSFVHEEPYRFLASRILSTSGEKPRSLEDEFFERA